jgi:superfamily II DNA or RNA helicase
LIINGKKYSKIFCDIPNNHYLCILKLKKMNDIITQELKKRGLKKIPYQVDYLTNPIYISPKEVVVLAAGTSAGKTKTTILKLELFYKVKSNKNKITLIVPASKTILRDNFEDDLDIMNEQHKLSFDYRVVKDKKEIESALKDKIQVIICLPQTLIKNHKLLPNLEMFVLDEAHQWYFKKTIQNILKHTKPKQTLLLTGTPSRFIERGGFLFKFVPVMELFELGLVSNVKMEVVSSSYDFKRTDWFGTFGHLKEGKTNSKQQAEDALLSVCNEMVKKLKNPIKGLHSINNITSNGVGKLFNSLNKTIIYTHSRKQATNFYNTLNTNKDLSGKVLLSHSENDKNSEEFKKFQKNPEYIILIAVDRGRLGFNMPELFNIVDFTMTQSLDMLLQMYGRLLRKSDVNPNKTKIYFKVATKNTADYFVDLMTAMLCLTNLEWYSKYNGKNMGGIRIPKVLNGRRTNNKSNTSSGSSTTNNRRTRPYISIEQLGIPLDLNFFKQDIFHSSNSLFNTVAWTTLSDVRNEFLDVSYTNWNEDIAKDFIEKNKINELSELRNIKSGFGLSYWLRENNLTEKFFGESKIKPWTDKTAKDFIKNCKAKKISDLRNHEKGSGLINWIINNDLTFTYFPESKDVEWTEKIAKDFIKKNKPSNFTHLSKMGSMGLSLHRWIYLFGGGRKKYFTTDEKIFWTDEIANKFIKKHNINTHADCRKIKGLTGLSVWITKNKKNHLFIK